MIVIVMGVAGVGPNDKFVLGIIVFSSQRHHPSTSPRNMQCLQDVPDGTWRSQLWMTRQRFLHPRSRTTC